MIVSLAIFIFCTWAVFSKHQRECLLVKNFFAFSAMTSTVAIYDPINYQAFFWSVILLVSGLAIWWAKSLFFYRKRHG